MKSKEFVSVDKVLGLIKQFQDEESKSYRQTYDGFNITKNNIALLQKLRRKLKKQLFNTTKETQN